MCVWGAGGACVCLPPPLSPLCTACVVQGAACAVVCVLLCWSARGVGEVGRRRALAGVQGSCCCVSRGLHFLPEQSALPPSSSHFAFPSAVFVCVCVFAMAVHHWPLGLAPTSPSSCCRIHRGMGVGGGGGGRAIHTRCPPGGPPPMHPCSHPSPHTQCTRSTRTLYHPAPTHLCNNRWEGDRDGCHDKLALL